MQVVAGGSIFHFKCNYSNPKMMGGIIQEMCLFKTFKEGYNKKNILAHLKKSYCQEKEIPLLMKRKIGSNYPLIRIIHCMKFA